MSNKSVFIMGYSSNKKFTDNTDDIGLVIDGCGNDHSKKFYYNGLWTDLCGMSIEEYMKPHCGGGGGGTVTKDENNIQIECVKGDQYYIYKARTKKQTLSEITINITLSSGESFKLVVPANGLVSEDYITKVPSTQDMPDVDAMTYSPLEDSIYKYTVSIPNVPGESYVVIHTTVPEDKVDNESLDDTYIENGDKADIDAIKGGNFDIVIPKVKGNEPADPDMPEKNAVVISIPKQVYEKNNYRIMENEINELTDEFKPLDGSYMIDGVEYIGMYRKCEGNEYASRDKERKYNYKIIK